MDEEELYNPFIQSISHKFIFQKVYDTTNVRPMPPQKNYVAVVIYALYEVIAAMFDSDGQVLDEQLFKSSNEVKKLADKFYKKVNQIWKKNRLLSYIYANHRDFFEKSFDFSSVDFSMMMSEGPMEATIEAPQLTAPVSEEPIEEAVDTVPNPWNVENLDDFLQYCCPECEVKYVSKIQFVTHAVDEHPRSHEYLPIFGLKPQRKIVKSKLLKKRKKVTEPEIEAKKSKVEAIPSFGATSEENHQHHSVEIVNNVEPKSDNEAYMDKDERFDSEPEPPELGREKSMPDERQESLSFMEEVNDEMLEEASGDVLEEDITDDQGSDIIDMDMDTNEEEGNSEPELTSLKLKIKLSDFVNDNEECDSESEPPELVSEDFPIIKIPCTTLNRRELYEIMDQYNIPFKYISPFSFTYDPPKMAKAMKKHHPLLRHISEMPLDDLRSLYELISSDCTTNSDIYRLPIYTIQKTLKEHYFKKHRKSPLTSFLKDKEKIMSIHQVIANFKDKKVKALIWQSGDQSEIDYTSKKAKAKLQKICFLANPDSPLSYLQKLECDQKESFAQLPKTKKTMTRPEIEAKKSKKPPDNIIDHWTDIRVDQKNCFLCESRYEDFVFLRNHMWTKHSSDNTFQCTKCEYKVMKSFDSYCFHLTKKHQIGDYLYKCLPCKKNFPRVGLLREHKTEFHPEGGNTSNFFPCPLCEAKFPKITYFGHHMRNVHSVDGNFNCHLCSDKFNNYNDFAFHLTEIHELGKFQYQCDICSKAFLGVSLKSGEKRRERRERRL